MHRLKLTFKVLFLIFTTLVFSGCNVSEKEKSKIVGQNANAPIQTNFYIYNNNPTGVNESNRATFPISGVCSEPGNPIDINYGPLVQTTTCRTDKTWLLSLDLTLVNDGTITFHAKEYRPNGSRPTDSHMAFKDSTDPLITGITTADDFTRANTKTFTWGCSETCTYRFSISTSPFPPSGAYSSVSSFTDNINDGLYYINIQAKDQAGNESTVLSKRYLIDTTNPSIIGLVNDSVPAQSKTWNWACSDAGGVGAGLCETRFLVDQNPTSSPSGSYSTTSTTTQNSGDGVWYLHIQTIDDVGNESPVYHYSAILDNTPPAQASINGMGSSPTIDTNNRTLTFSAPGDATHYQAVRTRTSLGSASPPAGCNYSNFDTNPSGGFTGEVAIGTNFDFVVDEGYDNYFCWITRDTLGNWETATRSVKLIANFPSGIILPMQGTCPTGWTEFTAGSGRILLGAGSGNNDADGAPLMIRTYASSGGLEETSGIPANTNLADTQVPATNLVYRSGNGYNLYADITLTDTLLDQQIPSDTNMPPYYVVRYCRKN